ncbi:MAG: TetR/AcrR family transcriptional regulator [bacterium]|nr:TetR/AcrR family transcriptional regulator [bacterium]
MNANCDTLQNSDSRSHTEDRILQAAEAECLAKGYAGARTTAIAEAAGVTHAMLHYYFRTKDKLFERILNEKIQLVRDIMLFGIGDPGRPLEERIVATVERHFDFLAANPSLPRFMVNEVFSIPERMMLIIDQMRLHAPLLLAGLQREIDDLAAEGRCRRVDARMLLLDIISLNIFTFMAEPIVRSLMGNSCENEQFLAARKRENVETIMRKLGL